MQPNTEKPTIEKSNHESFINSAVANVSRRVFTRCRHVASVIAFDGYIVKVSSLPCIVGSLCSIENEAGASVTGEVVRIDEDNVDIVPHDNSFAIAIGDKVILLEVSQKVAVGSELLGRVIDGLGHPLDQLAAPVCEAKLNLNGTSINPFKRNPIHEVLDVGIRNINANLTIGRGQRIGIVAGSGVGKSVLLSMISKSTDADIVVIALIGERGRELASFTSKVLASHSRDKVVVVAVPADRSPLLRIQGAKRATAVAEHFRNQGKNVLLIMDSLTRVAHAQREVGLALGEQPTSRGYPPSVISLLPNLIERTGASSENEGTITAIYTILADGDDVTSDPVVDTARAILDGHIVLSRELAQQGIYPAIDVNQSVSRLMIDIVDPELVKSSQILRKYISKYNENRDLILMGGYVQGQDPDLDQAMQLWPSIIEFLQQEDEEKCDFSKSVEQLKNLVGVAL
ncbi:MAG: FliI/YscN family ATPase [Paracoccaceae bacterium]|nr:FliI/YscN family ATPase [Paracoccaceae bacterium]